MAGVPGDVGGRAIGAELIECAARLCEYEPDAVRGLRCAPGAPASGERVFVKVMVTAKGSPAK